MFKYFSLIIFSFSLLSAARLDLPERPEDLISPKVVAARPGMYTVTLNRDITRGVLEGLSALPKKGTESYEGTPVEKFEELLRSCVYPHPSTVTGVKTLWKSFSATIADIREILEVGESLPYFSLSKYEKSGSLDEAIALFQQHIKSSLAELPAPPEPEIAEDILLKKLPRIKSQAQALLNQYGAFYVSRESPFRKHDIEKYIVTLLRANSNSPTDETSLKILDILQRNGCLTLASPITDSVFTCSPKAMVETYITRSGMPTTIVLGCGHADSRDMLETLGLKAETWCGACDKLPHAGAMVVSLDESSADILCDLNHSDLWTPLGNKSITAIHDETWFLSSYLPTTLDHIARVLKIGGKFHSNGYDDGLTIKTNMLARGFDVVKEDIDTRAITFEKVR